jgi:GAF domain-containing protein
MSQTSDGPSTTVRFLQEENQRLLGENRELREENSHLQACFKSIHSLQRAVSRLATQSELKPLLDRIMYEALRMVDAAEGSLSLVDGSAGELVFVAVRGAKQSELEGYRMPLGKGIVGWVIAHQEAAITNDIEEDPRFYPMVDRKLRFRTQSLICVPLVSRGKVLGAIELVNKFSRRPFDDRDMRTLSLLAPIAATAIDLAALD